MFNYGCISEAFESVFKNYESSFFAKESDFVRIPGKKKDGSLDLSVSTGKVTASDVSCKGDVTVGVSTGKVYLSDTQCKNVISRGNTGDISLDNVIAAEKFSIERSTGDVKFNSSDAVM